MAIILRVDTNVLKDQSNLVRDDIREIERCWNNIGKLINGTRGYWEGEASDAHIKVYRDIEPDVVKVIQRLKQNPVKLQMDAGIYDGTEQAISAEVTALPNEVFK